MLRPNPTSFTANETIPAGSRVVLRSDLKVELADSETREDGIALLHNGKSSYASGDSVAVHLIATVQTCVAAGSVSAGAVVYRMDDGKVDDTGSGAAFGRALSAAGADGDLIDVLLIDGRQTGDIPAALTENGGAIGGTNNGDLPDLTATAATVTGSLTGSTDGALADVAAIALSTAGGNTYSDSAVNTAVNTAITDVNLQLKELQTALNEVIADNVALRAAARENATKINELRSAIR